MNTIAARRLFGVTLALATGLAGAVVAAQPAGAATSPDRIVTVTTRANTAIGANTYGAVASYRITLNKAAIAQQRNAKDLDWTADVYIRGPGGYFESDFVWADSSWQAVYPAYPARPGTYTVQADVKVDGWTYSYSLGGYDNYNSSLYTQTVRESVTLKGRSVITQQRAKVGAQKWRTTCTLRVAGKAQRGAPVKLQRKAPGSRKWTTIANRRTTPAGMAQAVVKGRPGVYRWSYAGTSVNLPDVSLVFRMPRR